MPFVTCNKFNTSQATQDKAIADLAQDLLNKQNALNDCSGKPLAGTVPTCAQMTTAIQTAIDALPADKYLQGLKSYNPVSNTMTLLMSDGSTVDIDMTNLVADAVAGVSTAPTGAAGGDLQGTYPNPTVVPASTTQAGKVELATTAEATTGTSTTLAVTPAGLKAAIDAGASPTGAAGGILTGSYPNPGLNITKADGTPHTAGGCIMSCAETTAAIKTALVSAFIGGQEVVANLPAPVTLTSQDGKDNVVVLAVEVPVAGIMQASAGVFMSKGITYDYGFHFDLVLNGEEEIASNFPYYPVWQLGDYSTVTSRFIQVAAGDIVSLNLNPQSGAPGQTALVDERTNIKLKYLVIL